jgi:hypothetical protein
MQEYGETCSFVAENSFGPAVSAACPDLFDFTLLFEEIVLSILPLTVFGVLVRFIQHCSTNTPQ